MKIIFLLFLILFNVAANAQNEGRAFFDKSGFARCFEINDKVYFFDWDHFVKTSEKAVTYFEIKDYIAATSHRIKSCNDQKYLHDYPAEILHPISDLKDILPERIAFSLDQVAHGAHVYRDEKTAADYVKNRKEIFRADSPEVLTRLRHDVGDTFALQVMDYFITHIAVREKACESLIGTCDFYLCQEQKNPCGLDGYNLSYGYLYCSGSKFKLAGEMQTTLGKSWVSEVFQCLQRKNLANTAALPENEMKCREIKKQSYASHPDCYVEAGFCHLRGDEKKHIFSLIKKEILSFTTLIQGVKIIKDCAKE